MPVPAGKGNAANPTPFAFGSVQACWSKFNHLMVIVHREEPLQPLPRLRVVSRNQFVHKLLIVVVPLNSKVLAHDKVGRLSRRVPSNDDNYPLPKVPGKAL